MKRILAAFIAAAVFASLVLSPVSAAPAAASSCGDLYTVTRGDYLTLIARNCDTTLSSILSLNPQITNPNLIYAGQQIRLTSNAPQVPGGAPPTTSGGSSTTSVGNASVTVSSTRAAPGDQITVRIKGFPKNARVDYRVGERGESYSRVYDGVVDDDGTDAYTIEIPSSASSGEYWVVQVLTTDLVKVTSVTSSPILIGTTSAGTPTGNPKVTLSRSSARVGDSLTIYVSGFPANADIDYRIGRRGEGYSAVWDGKTNSSGSANITISVPSSAISGQTWEVVVLTTNLVRVTSKTSPGLTITN